MINIIKSSMKWSSALAVVAGFTLVFSSCSDEESAGANISPKEAVINYASNEGCQMVMSINLGDLVDKSGLKSDLLPAEMKMMADGYISQFLDSKENGLDINKPAFIIGDLEGMGQNSDMPKFIGIVLSIDNAKTFAAFIEGQTRMQPETGDNYSFVSMGKNGILAWNSGMAAFLMGKDFTGSKSSSALESAMKSMSEKGKGNTTALEKFTDKKADMGFFMDFENYMKVMPMGDDEMSKAMMENKFMKDMMKDATMAGFLNFENGKITLDYNMSGSKEMKKFISNAYKKGNPDFANYLGGDDLIGFGTMSLNIDAILTYYEKSGVFDMPQIADGLALIKTTTGLTIRDIANKFSGDFSIGFVGIEEDEEKETAETTDEYAGYYEDSKSTKPVITFAIGIRDSLMSKVFDTIPGLTKKGNYYAFEEMGGMSLKNGVLFITSNQVLLEDFALDGRLNTYSKNNAQKSISDNSVYGYFNFDALSKALMEVNPEVAEAMASMDYAEFKATKDASFSGVFHMKDKSNNALKLLGKMIIDSATKSGGMF